MIITVVLCVERIFMSVQLFIHTCIHTCLHKCNHQPMLIERDEYYCIFMYTLHLHTLFWLWDFHITCVFQGFYDACILNIYICVCVCVCVYYFDNYIRILNKLRYLYSIHPASNIYPKEAH